MDNRLIFEKSEKGKTGYSLPKIKNANRLQDWLPDDYLRESPPELPELSEPEVVRHFVNLSTKNHHVDKDLYPLGSCTMKYNPKINDRLSSLSGFADLNPHQPEETVQGILSILYEMQEYLKSITGLDAVTLQPAAGAHGELTGVLIIRQYHMKNNDKRKYLLIPDSAHGTNPSSVCSGGFSTIPVRSNERGRVDIDDLRDKMTDEVAGMMLTNPNTLGLFEEDILTISGIVHSKGGLMYMDGANLNALFGIAKPATMGFDICHINLHKTFSTPHGGGGPGSGPIAVGRNLEDFLPVPRIIKKDNRNNSAFYSLCYNYPDSIGKIHGFYGNVGVILRAYVYIRMMGESGLKKVSRNAILNANFIKAGVKDIFEIPYNEYTMHEFVASGKRQKEKGIRTLDIAKRLLDFGFHAPTIYFPLIVPEALMMEPTETEDLHTLNEYIDTLHRINKEAEETPQVLHEAPHTTPVRRLDETRANRKPDLRWKVK